jgi:hypothetical protein
VAFELEWVEPDRARNQNAYMNKFYSANRCQAVGAFPDCVNPAPMTTFHRYPVPNKDFNCGRLMPTLKPLILSSSIVSRFAVLPLLLLLVAAPRVQADDPAVILTDPSLQSIETVELFRSGLYWWRDGNCSLEFGHAGGASYRQFSNLRLGIGGSLSAEGGGFQAGGALQAGLFTGEFPSKETGALAPDCAYGGYFVRDDEAFYYAVGRSLYRKSLTLPPAADGVTVNTTVGPNIVPIGADGALAIDGPTLWSYFANGDGTMNVNTSGKSGIVLVQQRFTVLGAGVKKFALVNVKNANGTQLRRSALLLTQEGDLYEFNTDSGAPPTLLRAGVNDFAVRNESFLNPQLELRYATVVYAAHGHPVTYTGVGMLVSVDLVTGNAIVEFDTGSLDFQITSVAVDDAHIFITRTPVDGPGVPGQPHSDLLRRYAPANPGGIVDPDYESITLLQREYRSLRSDGQWLFFAHGNTVQKISTSAPAVVLDYAALGLEVTQGIQDFNNSVPLAARKPVVVRGYARLADNTTSRSVFHVPAELRVLRGGVQIPGSPFQPAETALVQTVGPLSSVRTNRATSFQFYVPSDNLIPGDTEFRFIVNPGRAAPETGATPLANNTASAVLPMRNVARPTLVFCVMSSTFANYDPHAANSGFWPIIARAESMLPVPGFDVRLRSGTITKPVVTALGIKARSFDMPGDQNLALGWLAIANATDNVSDIFSPPHYVGMFPQIVTNFNGKGGVGKQTLSSFSSGLYDLLSLIGVPDLDLPENPFTRSLIVRMSQETVTGAPWDNPMGGRTLAHELAHNYGRRHIHSTTNCGPQEPEGPYHDLPGGANVCSMGAIALDSPGTAIGFDPITWSVVLPSMNGDLMSYASNRWTSEFTWRAMLDAVPTGPFAGTPWDQGPVVRNDAGGGPVLIAQGFLNWRTNGAGLYPAYVLPADALDPETLAQLQAQTNGFPAIYPYRLQLLDAGNVVLVDHAMVLPQMADEQESYSFLQALPAPANAHTLRLMNSNSVLAAVTVSAHAPQISLGAPALSADGSTLNIVWTASDLDGDTLYFTVQYSADGGGTWATETANFPEQQLVLDTARLHGSANARIRVIGTDGFNSTIATSPIFVLPKHAPAVHLTGVADGEWIAYGVTISVHGFADDAEDGSLSAGALQWSLTGPESKTASGDWFQLAHPAPGAYTLTLTATDSDSQSGSSTIHFRVRPLKVVDGEEPVLDGLCDDPGYQNTPPLRVNSSTGSPATIHLTHANGALFACFSGVAYGGIGSPGASVGLRLDTTLAGTVGANAVGFAVDENGLLYRYAGNGSQLISLGNPPPGFSVVILRDQFTWNAELRIADNLLGGWNHYLSLAALTDDGFSATPPSTWPPGVNANDPGTWVPSAVGTPPPVGIAQHPVSVTGSACDVATFTVQATGPQLLTYQWRLDGSNLVNGPHIAGANSSTLIVSPLLQEHAGKYDVIVTDALNPSNTMTSLAAVLTITPGMQWLLRATNGPAARSGQAMTYDDARGVTVLFGGWHTNGTGGGGLSAFETFGDIWEWNGAQWSQRQAYSATNGWTFSPITGWRPSYSGRPVARTQHNFVFDNRRNRFVLFGGQALTPEASPQQIILRDTWEWDGANWFFLTTNGPAPRINAAMAFDPGRGVSVMMGGFVNGVDPTSGSIWEWDGTNWQSRFAANGPTAAYSQDTGGLAYDSFHGATIFGPSVGETYGWTFRSWDGANWATLFDNFVPQFFHQQYGDLAFDRDRRRAVWFGGNNPVANNTGFFDGQSWTVLSNSPANPSPRFNLALAYDENRRATVLFGGETANQVCNGETWELVALDLPLITEQPASLNRNPGGSATFTVAAIGQTNSMLTYQWYRNGVPLTNDPHLSGAQTATLNITPLVLTDGAYYTAGVSSDCGESLSLPAALRMDGLQISYANGLVTVIWGDPTAILQQADNLTGPWSNVSNAVSPLSMVPVGSARFFRLFRQN